MEAKQKLAGEVARAEAQEESGLSPLAGASETLEGVHLTAHDERTRAQLRSLPSERFHMDTKEGVHAALMCVCVCVCVRVCVCAFMCTHAPTHPTPTHPSTHPPTHKPTQG